MRGAGLSFEQAPPVSIPLRFFFAAPFFGMLAGLVLIFDGETLFMSRWSAPALALTHLMTAGYMLQIMVGALFQVLPVAGGGVLRGQGALAAVLQPVLVGGACALAAAFMFEWSAGYLLGAVAFSAGLGLMVVSVFVALWGSEAAGATLTGLRIALCALAVTVGLGAVMALARAGLLSAGWLAQVDLHVGWGLGGWGLVLLASVTWLVVPMFLQTKPYPPRFARGFAPALGAVLLAASMGLIDLGAMTVMLAAGGALFACVTLELLRRRQRAATNAIGRFWMLAMLSLLVAAVLSMVETLSPGHAQPVLLAGVLMLGGVSMSLLIGMLYKIVPFILWLKLRNDYRKVPSMNQFIGEPAQMRHFRLHLAMLVALAPAPWWSPLAVLGGFLMLASSALLLANLAGALQTLRTFNAGVKAAMGAASPPNPASEPQ